jgi:hypothetical protein
MAAADWAVEEMDGVDLRDKRLNERITTVLSSLASHPTASIPAACGGHSEMTAAYRLFENPKVTPERILAPHFERTRTRIAAQEVVILVQDTTEIDLSRPGSKVEGAGPLDGSTRRGCFLHLMEAFTPNGTPLGTVWAETWARDEESLQKSKAEKRKKRQTAPIEEKESYRWLQGLRKARDVAENCPETMCVCVADSEADIYDVFAEPRGEMSPVQVLVRLCHDRAVFSEELREDEAQPALIRHTVLATPVLFTSEITARGRTTPYACDARTRRQPREDRDAVVEVRALSIALQPPSRSVHPPVTVNVVLVTERNPPEGDEPVEWILGTTLPIDSVEQVQTVIQYYRMRWMIEVFFRTLKTGCRVEERRFETLDRQLCCLSVYLITTWRTLLVVHLGRSSPDMSCEVLFDPAEWKSVWVAVVKERPPRTPPRLQQMVRLIAQLGGYVNRPNRTDPPGPQTVWLGMQRMHDLAWAWNLFGPGATDGHV